MWLATLKIALSLASTAVAQISPAQWTLVGQAIIDWLQKIEDTLPAGNPLTVTLSSYRASRSKLGRPDDE